MTLEIQPQDMPKWFAVCRKLGWYIDRKPRDKDGCHLYKCIRYKKDSVIDRFETRTKFLASADGFIEQFQQHTKRVIEVVGYEDGKEVYRIIYGKYKPKQKKAA